MKRMKKITALVVTAAMALTLFTACVPLYLLSDFYDWFFGSTGSSSASSNASRKNDDGVNVSTRLENEIKNTLGAQIFDTQSNTNAKAMLEQVAQNFDTQWLTGGKLSGDSTQKSLDGIAEPYTKATIGGKWTITLINVCEIDQSVWKTYGADNNNTLTDNLLTKVYSAFFKKEGQASNTGHPFGSWLGEFDVKNYASGYKSESDSPKELCAGTFTKDGKYYAAFVIIVKNVSYS